MKKLLVICGPTATGKTNLGLHLAKKLRGEIISADSRQVYKYLDIGTGKDIPKNLRTKELKNLKIARYYEVDGVKIWAYDLVEPTEEFSVGQYVIFVSKILENIIKRKKLPILVGGTGLYIKGVVDGIPTASIPKNKTLRMSLESKEPFELYEILAQFDPVKAASMNASDKKNPPRLIRAIEIAEYRVKTKNISINQGRLKYDVLFIGLGAPKKYLYKIIKERVETRLKKGLEKEIRGLFEKGVTFKHQSMGSLGYKQFKGYFEGKKSNNEVIADWKTAEKKYTKRQMTWFKRDNRIKWFDITKSGWKNRVEKLVQRWYKNDIGKW